MAKRMRDADDEVFLDNYHNNKRYLTEVISSSLNGLKVGDVDSAGPSPPGVEFNELLPEGASAPLPKSSPTFRNYGFSDEMSPLDSLMSDDSEESIGFRIPRFFQGAYDHPSYTYPASPDRNRDAFSPSRPLTRSYSCPHSPSPSTLLKQRSFDHESCRLPPSPSDPCPSADLRRTALMRAIHLRALSPQTSRMYEDRKSKAEQPSEVTSMVSSPVHGQQPAEPSRPSASARSLHLEEKLGEGSGEEEVMYRSDDEESPKRRSRRNIAGDCCSRLKRGRFSEYGTGFSCSDAESTFS